MSIPLGAISLVGGSVSGVAMALTKKYQKKLLKVTKLTDIIISALAVFETNISKVLTDGKVDELEFTMLQALHLEVLNNLSNIDGKMAAETRSQFKKVYWKESATLGRN